MPPNVSSVDALHLWTGSGLDWSSESYVTLRLRRVDPLSTDATLSGLTVYDGSSNLTLSPVFAPSGPGPYTASAAYDIAAVTVTATKNQADATVAWLDASDATLPDADTSAAGFQVALEAGANTFKVKVTAEDGTTTKTYTVTVNRASPSCTLNTGDLWCGVVTVGNGGSVRPACSPGGTRPGPGLAGSRRASPAVMDTFSAISLGALSDRTFSVGTNNYTINTIAVQAGGFTPGGISFGLASGLTSADRAALVLHLGSTEYEFSDAVLSGGKSYLWNNAGLDWSAESFVTLRLRDTPVSDILDRAGKWSVPGGHAGRTIPTWERSRSGQGGAGLWRGRDLAPRHPCRLTVHFLIDAQLPPGLARWLAENGHRSVHVNISGSARPRTTQSRPRRERWGRLSGRRTQILPNGRDGSTDCRWCGYEWAIPPMPRFKLGWRPNLPP